MNNLVYRMFNSDIIHEYLRYKWNQEEVVVKLIKASNEMLVSGKDGQLEIAPRVSRTFAEEYLKLRCGYKHGVK